MNTEEKYKVLLNTNYSSLKEEQKQKLDKIQNFKKNIYQTSKKMFEDVFETSFMVYESFSEINKLSLIEDEITSLYKELEEKKETPPSKPKSKKSLVMTRAWEIFRNIKQEISQFKANIHLTLGECLKLAWLEVK